MLTTLKDTPADHALPALQHCLDPGEVLRACRSGLLRVDAAVRDAWSQIHMIEAMYHPQRYVRVVYAISDDPTIPANRVWPEGQIVYLHAPERTPMSRRGTVLPLNGVDVEAYTFPNDRRLRGLRFFAGRESCVRTWRDWLSCGGRGADIQVDTLQRLLVRYVPEQKWVVRLRAEIGSGAEKKKSRIAVRAMTRAYCERLNQRHRLLTDRKGEPSTEFVFPAVVGCDALQGMLGIEWLRGQSLVEAIRETGAETVMNGVARRLHALHQMELPELDTIGLPDIGTRIEAALGDLKTACPESESDLAHLEEETTRSLAVCGPGRHVTLHNDLHWNQLSIKRERYALLDLDRMVRGDPLMDVANFATEIQMLGSRPEIDVDQATADVWRATFLAAWRALEPCDIDRRTYAVCACLSRLELSRGMLRHLRPGWRELAHRCIDISLQDLTDVSTPVRNQ